jgi:2,3-bisphosphoglycerate-independent phosphoglycerate mutase
VQESARLLDASDVNAIRRRAGKLPGNLILTRDGGDHRPRLEPIRDRFGPTWGCFVEMPVERGIATLLGMAPVDAPRLHDEEDYAAWARLAGDALDGYDALYVHIKGPDVPAHDGEAEAKRDVIELIDRAFFGEVLPLLDPMRTIVAVTADHATSCVRKAHTAEPVPLLVSGGGIPSDGTTTFGEHAAAEGSLGRLRGVEILPRLTNLLRG